jgi:hypothetical protein
MTPQQVTDLYPFDGEVLFEWANSNAIKTYTDVPKRWEIAGRSYLPGKPSFRALIYTEPNTTMETIKAWKDARVLVAKLDHLVRRKDGSYVFHLNRVRIPQTYVTFNRYRTNALEWSHIVQNNACVHCTKQLNIDAIPTSSVNPKPGTYGIYKVVCHECVKKNVPTEKYNALVPSSHTPI